MIEKMINFIGTAILFVIIGCIATLFFPLVVTGMLLIVAQARYEIDDVAVWGFVFLAGIASIFTSSIIFSAIWNLVAAL